MNTYLWLLRRELWEYRSIWTLPAWVGFGLLLGTMLGTLDAGTGANHLTISFGFGALGREPRNVFLFSAIAATFYLLMTLYVGWYLLDCLYADRKDRSVLFWKSMPVSDRDTVLVKLVTAMVVIPMVFYGFAQLTTAAHAIFFSLRSGGRAALDPWNAGLWTGMQLLWLYAIFTGALWFLPVAGWMMLVSAWGRRAVFGWTLAVPVIAVVAERLVLGTQRVSDAIGERLWAG